MLVGFLRCFRLHTFALLSALLYAPRVAATAQQPSPARAPSARLAGSFNVAYSAPAFPIPCFLLASPLPQPSAALPLLTPTLACCLPSSCPTYAAANTSCATLAASNARCFSACPALCNCLLNAIPPPRQLFILIRSFCRSADHRAALLVWLVITPNTLPARLPTLACPRANAAANWRLLVLVGG